MYCHNCGEELREDALFCPSCGTKVRKLQDGNGETAPAAETKTADAMSPSLPIGKQASSSQAASSVVAAAKAFHSSTLTSDKLQAIVAVVLAFMPLLPQISLLRLGEFSVIDLISMFGQISTASSYLSLLGSSGESAVSTVEMLLILYVCVWIITLVVTIASCDLVFKNGKPFPLAALCFSVTVAAFPVVISALVNSMVSEAIGSFAGNVTLLSATTLAWVELVVAVLLVVYRKLASSRTANVSNR